jgi:hypothetical protein
MIVYSSIVVEKKLVREDVNVVPPTRVQGQAQTMT